MNCICYKILLFGCLQLVLSTYHTVCIGQQPNSPVTDTLTPSQQKALDLLNIVDTSKVSDYWPNIRPSLFFANIRHNILYPGKINQGKNTNFCSYAALTHLLLRYQPDSYTETILSLYFTGNARLYSKRVIIPSA